MPRRPLTRSERAIAWVESWCQTPGGKAARLTAEQRAALHRLYDGGLQPAEAVAGPLAAYLILLHLAGPEARSDPPARLQVDVFTLWNAASPELRVHLRRHGAMVTCPALGRSWPAAA